MNDRMSGWQGRIARVVLFATCMLGGVHRIDAQRIAARDTDHRSRAEQILARRVTIRLTSVSLERALDSIARVVRVGLQYQAPVLKGHPPVTVDVHDATLGTLLEQVLSGTGLSVQSDGQGDLIVAELSDRVDSVPQTGTITGRVVDSAKGTPVQGATVSIVGRKISVVTGDSGRFVLRNVPVGDVVLRGKSVGYHLREKEIHLEAGETITVRMMLAVAPNVLSGVVTTVTGVQDRRTVGNDITVINADSVMQTAPIRTLTDLLEGRVPGLTVQRTSGAPGAPARLRLRGITSGLVPGANQSNDPILIVDGIRQYAGTSTQRNQNLVASGYTTQSGYDQIDPNSIDKVEVFKGPSASALYGPDAANGVIVVTTKRGQAGVTSTTLAADYGISYMPGTYAGLGYFLFGHSINDGTSRQCDPFPGASHLNYDVGVIGACLQDSLVRFQALNVPRLSLFGTGNENSASLSVSGGSSTITYSVIGSVSNQLGYITMPALYQHQYAVFYKRDVPEWMKRPNRYTTATGQANLVSTPYSGLQLTISTSFNTSDQRQSSGDTTIAALSGKYIDTTLLQSVSLGQYTQRITSSTAVTNSGVTMAWTRWSWLHVRTVTGQSATDEEDQTLVPFGYIGQVGRVGDTLGYYAYARKTTQVQTASANLEFLPHAWVSPNVGFNVIKIVPKDFTGTVDSLSAGVASPSSFSMAQQTTSSLTTAGWYFEPRFNYGNRFFVAPGFRIDNTGTYKSGGGLQNGGVSRSGLLAALLPKMDFSWIAVDREGERPMFGVLTSLRPRIAFGVSGTQPNPAQLLRNYVQGNEGCGGNVGTCYHGIRLSSVGNPFLHPERSRELETGFEAFFWENRAQLVVSRARRWTIDAIAPAPLAPSAGSLSLTQDVNIGNIRNVTTEIQLNVTPLQNHSTSWNLSASYSAVKNTVLKVNGTGNAIELGNGARAVVGYPLDGRWERPILGYVDPGPGRKMDAADVLVGDSLAYVGSAQPGYTMPITSSLSLWGGTVTFSALMNYEHGFTQFGSGNKQSLINTYLDPSATLGQKAAVVAAFCTPDFRDDTQCRNAGTMYGLIQTVNTLRLNSLSLNYNVPERVSQRLRLPKTSLQLQGSNLGLWTGYRGKDPDVNGTPVGEAIEDSGQQPLARSLSVRVTLSPRGHKS